MKFAVTFLFVMILCGTGCKTYSEKDYIGLYDEYETKNTVREIFGDPGEGGKIDEAYDNYVKFVKEQYPGAVSYDRYLRPRRILGLYADYIFYDSLDYIIYSRRQILD